MKYFGTTDEFLGVLLKSIDIRQSLKMAMTDNNHDLEEGTLEIGMGMLDIVFANYYILCNVV